MRILMALVLVVATASEAFGQACVRGRHEMVEHLKSKFEEHPVASGISTNDYKIIEVLSSPFGATWTMISTGPDGFTCLVAAGSSWETFSPDHQTLKQKAER